MSPASNAALPIWRPEKAIRRRVGNMECAQLFCFGSLTKIIPARADGGYVNPMAAHQAPAGPCFARCEAKPSQGRWYFWY